MTKERISRPETWLVVRQFGDQTGARKAFNEVAKLLKTRLIGASIFALAARGGDDLSLVAVTGENSLSKRDTSGIEEALRDGEETGLPTFVQEWISQRRKRFLAQDMDNYMRTRTVVIGVELRKSENAS